MKQNVWIYVTILILILELSIGVYTIVGCIKEPADISSEKPIVDISGKDDDNSDSTLPDGSGEGDNSSDSDSDNQTPENPKKVARVIILAGQSNAAGCTYDEYLKQTATPEKYAEYERGYDNILINYKLVYNTSDGFVKCAARQGEHPLYFGPELGLAERLNEMYPGETFFIIKYAVGGTNLFKQWLSPSSGEAGELYLGLVEFIDGSIQALEAEDYEVKIEGMCWMQGESDSCDEFATENYGRNTANLIGDIRNEFADYASDDGIAFIDAYISDSIYWLNYTKINEAKQQVADSSPINVVINTIAAGLIVTEEPAPNPDLAHYDSQSEIKLGALFAEALAPFFDF